MKKHLLFASLALMSMLPLHAKQLSAAEALQRASAADGTVYRSPGHSAAPVYTAAKEGINHFYVFAAEGCGFAVLSADDQLPAVLAYSDSGSFDLNNMPNAARAWLDYYQQQIADVIDGNASAMKAPAYRTPIGPLITTKWNQTAPYNDNCSFVPGYGNAVTGCVATAMAQVMNYHKWPQHGNGSNQYVVNYGITTMTYEEDFSQTYFDWDNMLESYTVYSDPTARKAVATLMRSCGISVNMTYNNNESSASTERVVSALVNNFDYSKHVSLHYRDCYNASSWDDLLYAELQALRPVIYSGTTVKGKGHTFIVDGYDSGYYHVNWGWGGLSDGYFLLSLCDPSVQGTGGADSGYEIRQSAITGINKPMPGDDYLPFCLMQNDDIEISASASYIVVSGSFYAQTTMPTIPLKAAVKLTDAAGKVQYAKNNTASKWPNSIVVGTLSVAKPSLANGAYTAEFAVEYDGKYYDMVPARGKISKWNLTVKGSTFTFEAVKPTIQLSHLKTLNKCHPGHELCIEGTVNAPLGYNSAITAQMYISGTSKLAATLDSYPIALDATDAGEFAYKSVVPSSLESGVYDIEFVDKAGEVISPRISVEASKVTLMLPTVTGFYITRNPAPRDSVNFVIEASMPEGGFYDLDSFIRIYDMSAGGSFAQKIALPDFVFESGDSKSVKVDFDFVEGVEGHQYVARLETDTPSPQTLIYGDWLYFILEHPYVALEGVALSESALTLTEGEYAWLFATYSPEDATDHNIVWSSTNPEVAAVDAYGFVTAVSPGEAVIVAACGDFTAECAVTVKARQKYQYITWTQDFSEVSEGDEVVLLAYASSDLAVSYTAIGPGADCVEIDGNLLKCLKPGSVTVRAYQTGNDEYLAAEPVDYLITIQESNGITDVQASGVQIRALGCRLIIDHKSSGSPVKVVSITGQTVYTGSASEITLPAKGIYIVRCEGRTFKVSVK